jgi:hypothetical protein
VQYISRNIIHDEIPSRPGNDLQLTTDLAACLKARPTVCSNIVFVNHDIPEKRPRQIAIELRPLTWPGDIPSNLTTSHSEETVIVAAEKAVVITTKEAPVIAAVIAVKEASKQTAIIAIVRIVIIINVIIAIIVIIGIVIVGQAIIIHIIYIIIVVICVKVRINASARSISVQASCTGIAATSRRISPAIIRQ